MRRPQARRSPSPATAAPTTTNITKAFLTGFEAKTGIKVNLGDNASLALAKLQAAANPAQWDIVELDGPEYEVAVRQKPAAAL